MQANNLTISTRYRGCDKGCPYCVSKMIWAPESHDANFAKNFEKMRNVAKAAGVTSVLITSKGEPMLDQDHLFRVIKKMNDFPVELQTNGIEFRKHPESVLSLALYGCDILAISMDNIEELEYEDKEGLFSYLCKSKKNTGLPLFKSYNLNEKSISILSIPILDHEKRPWGVLTVDSTQKGVASLLDPRKIENEIEKYAYAFRDREVK